MDRWRITSNYGTFEIVKEIEAEDYEGAYCQTGIGTLLLAAGWEWNGRDGSPDGEYHLLERWDGERWIEEEG